MQSNVVNSNDAWYISWPDTGLLHAGPMSHSLSEVLGVSVRNKRHWPTLSSPLEANIVLVACRSCSLPSHSLFQLISGKRVKLSFQPFSVWIAPYFPAQSDSVLSSAFSSKQHPTKYPCYPKRSWSDFGVGRCGSRCAERKCPGIQAGVDSG